MALASQSSSAHRKAGNVESSSQRAAPESGDGIENLRKDPSRIDSMTVTQLRRFARDAGISSKGNKKDLVAALKCFTLNGNAANLENIVVERKNMHAKRKGKPTSVDDDTDLENVLLSEFKQKRSRKKQQSVRNATVVDGSVTVSTKKELSVEAKEVAGNAANLENIVVERKSMHAKRKGKPTSFDNDTDVENVLLSEFKQKRSRKKLQSVRNTTVVDGSVTVSTKKELSVEAKKVAVDVALEPWTVLAHKKPRASWTAYNPRTMRPPPLTRDEKFVKLMSWNVNGLRALLKLESFSALQLAQMEDFDILCLQETKIQEKDVEAVKERLIAGYDYSFWTCSVSKVGYSGTAIISRIKPISVKYGLGIPDHDTEGRLVTVEFDDFFLISGYVPNSGDGLKRLTYRVTEWDPSLSNFMKDLEKLKPVILTGDLNCAHEEIDIYDPAGHRRSAGFTSEERESFKMNFLSKGFVDTFRKQHPDVVGYTFWSYRSFARKVNKGWRLDYYLVSEALAQKVYDSYILPHITGSDHCPIGLVLKL